MADEVSLRIAQRSLVVLGDEVVDQVHLDLEEAVRLESLRGAERADDDAGREGARGDGVLDGEVLLCLDITGKHCAVYQGHLWTYDFNDSLAVLLHCQGKLDIESRGVGRLAQHEEGLVRALGLSVLLCRQDDLNGVLFPN